MREHGCLVLNFHNRPATDSGLMKTINSLFQQIIVFCADGTSAAERNANTAGTAVGKTGIADMNVAATHSEDISGDDPERDYSSSGNCIFFCCKQRVALHHEPLDTAARPLVAHVDMPLLYYNRQLRYGTD